MTETPHGDEEGLEDPDRPPQITPPQIVEDQQLPGLKLGNELPEGTKYWDQVIPSPFGDLTYQQPQRRDGKIRWRTADRKVEVVVESGTGKVVAIHQSE